MQERYTPAQIKWIEDKITKLPDKDWKILSKIFNDLKTRPAISSEVKRKLKEDLDNVNLFKKACESLIFILFLKESRLSDFQLLENNNSNSEFINFLNLEFDNDEEKLFIENIFLYFSLVEKNQERIDYIINFIDNILMNCTSEQKKEIIYYLWITNTHDIIMERIEEILEKNF